MKIGIEWVVPNKKIMTENWRKWLFCNDTTKYRLAIMLIGFHLSFEWRRIAIMEIKFGFAWDG